MAQTIYYEKVCRNCTGFKICEPRDEDNIRDCKTEKKQLVMKK